MKHEVELNVQAWVDGELSESEAARIAKWVANDAEAGVLASELSAVKKSMLKNELCLPLPESREFHWSKIARQIQLEESREAAPVRSPVSWLARWQRIVLPLTGVTAVACVLSLAVKQVHRTNFDEISATDQSMEAVTFHDQSADMTVVWLQDNSPASEAAQPGKTAAPLDKSSDTETD